MNTHADSDGSADLVASSGAAGVAGREVRLSSSRRGPGDSRPRDGARTPRQVRLERAANLAPADALARWRAVWALLPLDTPKSARQDLAGDEPERRAA
jgi:hypothetical protein